MRRQVPPVLKAFTITSALFVAACSSDADSVDDAGGTIAGATTTGEAAATPTPLVATGPPPLQMCTSGALPILAAYDLATGTFKWAACGKGSVRRTVLEASDEVVLVAAGDHVVTYSTSDGAEVPPADPATHPTPPYMDASASPVIDGVRITGGQDDPTTATDVVTGQLLWTHPGSTVYDGVWAVGDGAVYVTRQSGDSPLLVAYELRSGDLRWKVEVGRRFPWLATDELLFAMWTNLAVIDTDDGSTIWQTDYPDTDFPRMTGVGVNADTAFVAFSTVASGGD